MKPIAVLFFFLLPTLLSANTEAETFYTEDRYFVTRGQLDFDLPHETVAFVLEDYHNYKLWAFEGMRGIDKESEGLIVSFSDVSYNQSLDQFLILFDLNVIWPFTRKDNPLHFKPVKTFDNSGDLKSLALIPQLSKKLVEDAQVIFHIQKRGSESSIVYETKIRLTPFLDFFFSLRAYKRNFEWYVYKVAENFTNYLNRQAFPSAQ